MGGAPLGGAPMGGAPMGGGFGATMPFGGLGFQACSVCVQRLRVCAWSPVWFMITGLGR